MALHIIPFSAFGSDTVDLRLVHTQYLPPIWVSGFNKRGYNVDGYYTADGDSDHTFEDPFSREFVAPRPGVLLQAPAQDGLRRKLRSTQRTVDPLSGERIEEIGGVADE